MMKLSASVVTVMVLLAPLRAEAQTAWFKYEGNPVMLPGPPGSWDDATVFPSRVLIQDTVYRMWYTGFDGTLWRTGHAQSSDGVTWTKSTENPVLKNGPDEWDKAGSTEVYVVPAASGYKMWYRGDDLNNRWRIGYAESPDGLVWTKANANPLIGPGSWYPGGLNTPSVLGPDRTGGYTMWFTGEPMYHGDFQLGYATATDETSWTAVPEPVLSYGSPGTWDDDKVMAPRVLFNGETYEMWYCGERSDGRTHIGYASSVDGLAWTKAESNPVFRRGPGWDANDIYCLDIVFDRNIYHMWYGGNASFLQWRIGYAVAPKGLSLRVVPAAGPLNRTRDTVRVTVHVAQPNGLSFFAEFESPDGVPIDTLSLFDDGAHGDSLAGDGVFANAWVPGDRSSYSLDLKLRLHDTLSFEMNNITSFTPVTSISGAISSVPGGFSLEQNFPNPFNPSTVINYTIGGSGGEGTGMSDVSLVVNDCLGRTVVRLVDEMQTAGSHQVTFDAQGLSSGVYFYRLKAGRFVATKKAVLIK